MVLRVAGSSPVFRPILAPIKLRFYWGFCFVKAILGFPSRQFPNTGGARNPIKLTASGANEDNGCLRTERSGEGCDVGRADAACGRVSAGHECGG